MRDAGPALLVKRILPKVQRVLDEDRCLPTRELNVSAEELVGKE